uniref:Uncharacterized protein n=1 Tax=Brassica oleracea var. oleracea TaxID=109376 RepID=A0A0D3AKQ8_BRAOL
MDPGHCIYKVSKSIRNVKPQAYRPQVVLIGLHNRSIKQTANDGAGTSSDQGQTNKTKQKYVNMEKQKKTYLKSFTEKVGPKSIQDMKEIIIAEEKNIRGSYEISTEWVPPESFVDHILEDSVFIMEFIITHGENSHDTKHTADVKQDLMLLENQLPFFIFQKLFGSHMEKLGIMGTVEQFILNFFSLKIKTKTNFRHFTDMFRCVYEESLEETPNLNDLTGEAIGEMANADYLSRAGVKFKTPSEWKSSERERSHSGNLQPMTSISSGKETDDYSLHVSFKEGCLVMSSFRADEASETILRNVIAFEQSHGAVNPFTSNYINFINLLITNERDVEVLTAEDDKRFKPWPEGTDKFAIPRLVVKEPRLRCPPSRLRAPATADLTSLPLGCWTPYGGIVGTVAAQIPELSKKKVRNTAA